MRKIIFILSFFFSFSFLKAEKLHVHFDKGFYVSGEVMQFAIFFPKKWHDQEFALKVLLLDNKGQLKDYQFLQSKGQASTSSYFKLSYDLPSANHIFLIQGFDKQSKKIIQLGNVQIPIYNDLLPIEENPSQSNPISKTPIENTINIQLDMGNTTVQKRQEIKPTFLANNSNGQALAVNWSMTITDIKLTKGFENFFSLSLPKEEYILSNEFFYEGRVESPNGTAIQANVLGAYTSLYQKMYFAKSDALGKMVLRLPPFEGEQAIQIFAHYTEHEGLIFTPLEKYALPFQVRPISYPSEIIAYLESSRQRKKINQLFRKEDFALKTQNLDIELPYWEPDAVYDFQKYDPFKSLEQFFREHLTPLRFKKEKEKDDLPFYAAMYNPEKRNTNKYFPDKPVFIIDGKITKDGNYVAGLDFMAIKQVDLFFDPKKLHRYFNLIGNNGLTIIQSYDGTLQVPSREESNIRMVKGTPLEQVEFSVKDLSTEIPYFTSQLFWQTQHDGMESSPTQINYIQSDDKSEFQIDLIVQDTEGNIGRKQISYTVK